MVYDDFRMYHRDKGTWGILDIQQSNNYHLCCYLDVTVRSSIMEGSRQNSTIRTEWILWNNACKCFEYIQSSVRYYYNIFVVK